MNQNNLVFNSLASFRQFVLGIFGRISSDLSMCFDRLTVPQKILFLFLALFLSVYLTAVLFVFNSSIFIDSVRTVKAIVTSLFLVPAIFFAVIYGCLYLKKPVFKTGGGKQQNTAKVFHLFFFPGFILLLIPYLVNFPGNWESDITGAWDEVQTFTFSDAHPAIYKLILWIITRIANQYGFVIFVQFLLFCTALSYLFTSLYRHGFPFKTLFALFVLIVINPMNKNILTFAYKDTWFSIGVTFLAAFLINIYFTDGKWASNAGRILALAAAIALTGLLRHNGIFYTVPLLFLLSLFYFKEAKGVVLSAALSILLVLCVKFPLYSALNVSKTGRDRTFSESVGIPMAVLANILVTNKDALDPKTQKFLYDIAPDEDWREKFKIGDYNSVKYPFGISRHIIKMSSGDFTKMFLDAVKSDPRNAFLSFRESTSVVWNLFPPENRFISAPRRPNIEAETNKILKTIKYLSVFFDNTITSILPLGWLFTSIGWQMCLLMTAGIVSCYNRGNKLLLFIVPPVAYNLGTMILLSSPGDLRFFQFNFIITMPFLLVLLSEKAGASNP